MDVSQGKAKTADEEKFLKGVRICRDCRPALLRRQHVVETSHVPLFQRLYEGIVHLEKAIEDSLPQFEELLVSLSKSETQSPEAKALRKRLLDAFADYDALAKRIRDLPCAPGSSQDRIQSAIIMRANLFLQQHMFPLQALPKAANRKSLALPTDDVAAVDPDSTLALALQPLLEQEKLLEQYVEQAKAQRKFEDAKTLQTSLVEIRAEIDRLLEQGHVMKESS